MMLVLASQSGVRRQLLDGAGLSFEVEAAGLDEAVIKNRLSAINAEAADIAVELAAEKALIISRRRPADLVIGADQILACGAEIFDKPADLAGARRHLQRLRGRTHFLHCAACLARDGEVIWRHLQSPRLTMRDFSDDFITAYLDRCGATILSSVGAYRLEDLGVQLFAEISGDYFSVLGLPLLPLLAILRQHGASGMAK
jgi:septum formation protein